MILGFVAGLCLGVVVMYVAMMFVRRQLEKSASVATFAGFLGVVLGGAAVAFLSDRLGANSVVYSAYAIGLFAGFVLWLIIAFIKGFEAYSA